SWVSPYAANIYASIKLQLLLDEGAYGMLSLLIGVAVCRVLKEVGIEGVSLKWPNDIYVNRAKLAGVLIEYAGEANGPVSTIIGMGMNIKMPVDAGKNIDQAWTDLDSIIPGVASRRNQLCASLVNHVLLVLEECESGNSGELLDEWRQYDMLYDQDVVLQLPKRKICGRARGVNMRGQLLIEQAEGKLAAYVSGEISVRVKT
ncbi:MAG TPA: biotin--[acetyl-CoA-carboxylase] ligase, partial [Gammaproteobacteria bacterium]|nr:biotin--[acetyl-CoA-carboxylase] ligase [Gammaproteobacteria bacterium]